ncbi:WG repeat-containing protein [Chryseobacterium sp. SSA4.19]|uniref:WG repeat-containing protein n=1 Tax=Chryseobacterium sp. SSA4.19 TaxID=2919915 RepID=UPI001F4E198E|nr:WG repeat-containing protein [Chryseobacterium sp. SSA4.19]MCJ8154757.1 WG repeat-containing protein [Chryseobacterium sp. SSA4.19]
MMKRCFTYLIVLVSFSLTAQNLVPYNDKGKYGLCDINGKILLEPIYSDTDFFSVKTNGYSVKKEGKYGLLNKDLKVVIPFISINPVIGTDDGYIVYFSENELHYYSKNYQLLKKRMLEKTSDSYGPVTTDYAADKRDHFTNEKVLELFKKKYPRKGKYHVVSANNTYYRICSENDKGKCTALAVFLPKASVFLISDEQKEYHNVTWNPGTSMYYILVKSGTKEYVIDQNEKTVFPAKEYDRLYIFKNYIGYKDKNSSSKKSVTHYFIISSGVIIENKFSSFDPVKSLTVEGKNFDIFKATINNYDLHQSQDVYIGENGKQYFKADFTFDN